MGVGEEPRKKDGEMERINDGEKKRKERLTVSKHRLIHLFPGKYLRYINTR